MAKISIITNFQYQHSIFLLNIRRQNEHLKGYHLLIADAVEIFDIVYWNLVSDTNMDDVLESGGWRTHSTCHCHCLVWRDKPPTPLPVILFIFLFFSKYPQSLFHFQHMTVSHWCYRPPHPAMAPPVRRLRRSSARRSDPTSAGSARITVPSETVWTTAINGNGQQYF